MRSARDAAATAAPAACLSARLPRRQRSASRDAAAVRLLRPHAQRDAVPASRAPLTGLPVERVLAAPAAVLLELHAVGRVPLRFLGRVVAPLALGAREGDSYSDSRFGHGFFFVLWRRGKVAAGGVGTPPNRALFSLS